MAYSVVVIKQGLFSVKAHNLTLSSATKDIRRRRKRGQAAFMLWHTRYHSKDAVICVACRRLVNRTWGWIRF